MRIPAVLPAVAVVVSGSTRVSGATLVVTNTNDAGPGSLRQAIETANANPGPDTITFNIAGPGPFTVVVSGARLTTTDPVTIDGSSQPLYPGQPLIEIVGQLHVLGGNSTIRGLSIHSPAIDTFGTRGEDLILGRDPEAPSNPNGGNVVQGCYIGLRPDGVTRGSNVPRGHRRHQSWQPDRRDDGRRAQRHLRQRSGRDHHRAFVSCCAERQYDSGQLHRATADGSSRLANVGDGIRILGASNNSIGGVVSGSGNVISGNGGAGVRIEVRAGVGASNDNVIQGNFIGTDVTGLTAVPNGVDGIILRPGDFPSGEIANNLIGGTAPGAGNVISGNHQGGIWIGYGNATGTLIQGNLIGLAADGVGALGNGYEGNVPPIPHSDGVFFEGPGAGTPTSGPHENVVGGLAAGAGNRIAFNAGNGVAVAEGFGNLIAGNEIHANGHAGVMLGFLSRRTAIRGNSMHDNGNLGIDILDIGPSEGPTANDACDVDAGLGNDRQNFPGLTSAERVAGATIVRGTLNSAPNATFTLEFFSNPAGDPSGFGEGREVLGTATVTTGPACVADFTSGITLSSPVQAGHYVSATATDADGNTSEFSMLVQAIAVTQPTTTTLQAVPNPATVGQSVQLTATATGQSPTGTVDFLEGSTVLSSEQLMTGSAVLSTSNLAAGNAGGRSAEAVLYFSDAWLQAVSALIVRQQ